MARAAPAIAAAALGLSACAASPFQAAGWERFEVRPWSRVLAAATPAGQEPGTVLTVILEGDGAAHDARGRPTADPTPRRPTGFEIARAWPDSPKAWLGRLCQYVRRSDPACQPADWTRERFAETAVQATDAAIDELKRRAGAEQVRLVGWSGGGVLAVAVAWRRSDVAGLATFAAPLDLEAGRGCTGCRRWRSPRRRQRRSRRRRSTSMARRTR